MNHRRNCAGSRHGRFCAVLALLLAGCLSAPPALADAGQGELAGHRLGERVALDLVQAPKPLPDGSLRVAAAGAAEPFDSVYLYASPRSGQVGKIALTRRADSLEEAREIASAVKTRVEADYPDWDRLRAPMRMGKTGGQMISRLQQGRHALIVFYRPMDEAGFEVVLELEYASKAPQRKAWRALVAEERAGSAGS